MNTTISRKTFLKGLAASTAGVTLLGICPSFAAGGEGEDQAYVPGVYTAEAAGLNGLVRVSLTVDEGSILHVEISDEAETVGIGSKAVERMPALILQAQSAQVDGIAGATITSNAIKAAAAEALDRARAGESSPEAAASAALGTLAFTPGLYTAAKKGYAGLITVESVFSADRIDSVTVVSCGDTAHISRYALDYIPGRIVEAQSLRIDAAAGATYTSSAILNAVANCAEQAGCDPQILRRIPVETSSEAYELEADVVVVGGGVSGVSAAVSAAENGAKVILVEKSLFVGGCSFASSSNLASYNSRLQQEAGAAEEDVRALYEEGITDNHWHLNMPLFYRVIHAFSGTADWLYSRGLGLVAGSDSTRVALPAEYTERNAAYVRMLEDSVAAGGGMVLYGAKVTDFLTDAEGAVCGVSAEGSMSGDSYTIHAKAVVMCSGGWGGNPEMVRQYSPAVSVANYALGADNGEVTRAAWNRGAARAWNTGAMQYHQFKPVVQTVHFEDPTTKKIARTISFMATALHVNGVGRRFRDETLVNSPQPGSNSLVLQDGFYYVLISQEMVDVFTEKGWAGLGVTVQPANPTYNRSVLRDLETPWVGFQDVLDYMVEQGGAFFGEDIAALAEAAGMDPDTLLESFTNYNRMCEAGEDSYVGKDPAYLIAYPENGPFYLVKCELGALGSTSGIDIDDRFRVLGEDGLPLKGLFAAGAEAVGNILNDAYHFSSYANGFAFTSGRLAGMEAAASVL